MAWGYWSSSKHGHHHDIPVEVVPMFGTSQKQLDRTKYTQANCSAAVLKDGYRGLSAASARSNTKKPIFGLNEEICIR